MNELVPLCPHLFLLALKQTDELMGAIRDAVGDAVDIMIEFHGRCGSVSAALAYIDVLAPCRTLDSHLVCRAATAARALRIDSLWAIRTRQIYRRTLVQ